MSSRADQVAQTVIDAFSKLPQHRKPTVRSNGLHEWVPLSGIIAEVDGDFYCLALATGTGCLPASKIPLCSGVGIHDWHAEVLAIRGFNRYLLDCCKHVGDGEGGFNIVVPCDATSSLHVSHPYHIRDEVKLHMYSSEAPCGDASMELIMAEQADATPWEPPIRSTGPVQDPLAGRTHFSELGRVRSKPGRGDAPASLSKSCSDKLALKQCTSLLSAVTSVLIDPSNAYIDSMVIPASQFSAEACRRSFASQGRMRSLVGSKWEDGYSFTPFFVETTSNEFGYSKRMIRKQSGQIVAYNLATVWSISGVEESLCKGVLQGKRAFHPRGASRLSRSEMWRTARAVAENLGVESDCSQALNAEQYKDVKAGTRLQYRALVKMAVQAEALKGWLPNDGDSEFSLHD